MALTSSPAAPSLNWEWPAGRRTDRFIGVRLTDVAKEGGGLFGIRRSPSLADALPNAMVLKGVVVAGPNAGGRIRLRAPGGELPPLTAGDRAAFGLVEDRICICVRKVPAGIADSQLANWLSHQSCGG